MKKLWLVLFAMMIAAIGWAQAKKNNLPQPDIEFKVLEHDFGQVKEGTSPSFDFVFTNKGKGPLVLTNVRASCGCTTPHWPREPIMPGDTAKITAVYNTKGRPGNFHKTITVQTNDPDERLVVLIIKGNVVRGNEKETPRKMPVKSPVRRE